MAAAPIAAVSSIASLGFGFAGAMDKAQADTMRGQAVNAQDQFEASQSDRAARFGRLQAGLTDVTMRERLTSTLSNIDAIRAGGNVDAASPTTQAVEDFNRKISDRQRMAAVVTARSQADAEEAKAAYLRQSGQFALAMGDTAANADMMAGFANLAGGIAKGIPGLS